MTPTSAFHVAGSPAGDIVRGSATLADLIDELARTRPDRAAVTDVNGTLTFSQLRAAAIRLAKALHATGIRPGDSVGILMGNRAEWIVSCFAAQYLGATVVAVNTWYTRRELGYVLSHADVRLLIMARTFLRSDYVAMLTSLRPWNTSLPSLQRVVVLEGTADGMVGWDEFLASGDTMCDGEIAAMQATVKPDDIALLLYTSGSTASPKGVRLAHWGLLKNCYDIGERQHLTENDVLLLPISLFWGFGCSNAMMAALTHATHMVLLEHFDAEAAVSLIERFRCTAIYGTANIMQSLLDLLRLSERNISTLRTGLTFGSATLMREVIDRLAPDICHIFGFTEGYGNSTVTDVDDPVGKRLNSTGRVLPGSELRIVDPATEQTLPSGQEGEIRVRGCIMAGYHKDPTATANAFDRDGFFRTGDLGALDEDGYLHFRGRLKEMIKTGGMNVSPAEVEEILRAHPCVREAFVTGLPDPAREEVVGAVIVLVDGVSFSADDLTAHCRASLSAFKVPRRFQSVSMDMLPLTTTLKIHRARLAELFE
ncbi:class I adenylate-forming enzyme family protein [Xanthobacter autotrophicus]|uniref:class I adenylate-forming enzyme family protein n=1 Tax=Xanthobacter autotrophicus TaxID=280 RepID=UPI00372A6D72